MITFEEGSETLQNGITKLYNILDGLEPNFTPDEHIKLYTTVYNLCSPNAIPSYDRQLYNKYKETCEHYITSKVLPSLQVKEGEPLLRELLERWSNYKIMTKRLSSFFSPLDRYIEPKFGLPSLEETSFLSFYHLVYEGMNQEIMDAISSMIDRKLAGEKVDQTFVINTLDFSLKFDEYIRKECTRKNRTKEVKMDCSLDVLSKKINLISSDEAVFEVDYGTALVSKRFEDIIKTIPVGDVGNISVHEVRSKMMTMVIEYCKMHKHNNGLKDFELKDWDAQFVNVDPKTLLDLLKSACYLRVDSLVDLTWNEVDSLIKGKTREEIAEIFGAVDDSNSKLLEENNE